MLHKHENVDAQTAQALHSRFLGILSEMIIAWLLKKQQLFWFQVSAKWGGGWGSPGPAHMADLKGSLPVKARKESDNGSGLWGLSPGRQAVTAAAAVVVIPSVPRWPLKRKNGSRLWAEIWGRAYSPTLSLFVWKAPRHLPAWLWS